jgi:Stress responsive A/B Barrel Domain
VLRHSAFFLLKEGKGEEEMRWMQKGSAFMRFTSAGPVAIDFGQDLFGGSLHLYDTKPWERTPRWRAATEGPPSNYDVALHLDFEDEAGLEAYNEDDVHHEIAVYNAAMAQGELTARVDWWYDGGPLIVPGHVRHAEMFVWKDDADEATKARVLSDVKVLADEPGVERVTVGKNVGSLRTDYDWILDVQLPDRETAERFVSSDRYREAIASVAAATKYEWTARMTHTMHGH